MSGKTYELAKAGIVVAAGCALLGVMAPVPTKASQQVDICAKYASTGQVYHVRGVSTSGSELNQTTRSSNYKSFSRYIVIYWAQDRVTIIEMPNYFVGPSFVQSDGTDQEGGGWSISGYSLTCFQ